mmetsp:Transcript_12217/g.44572  ORF Transcript_12217/g.44572 Transcript_12217/m.44572 type:complete len:330 (-) Transcript_12217:265-1254(-)
MIPRAIICICAQRGEAFKFSSEAAVMVPAHVSPPAVALRSPGMPIAPSSSLACCDALVSMSLASAASSLRSKAGMLEVRGRLSFALPTTAQSPKQYSRWLIEVSDWFIAISGTKFSRSTTSAASLPRASQRWYWPRSPGGSSSSARSLTGILFSRGRGSGLGFLGTLGFVGSLWRKVWMRWLVECHMLRSAFWIRKWHRLATANKTSCRLLIAMAVLWRSSAGRASCMLALAAMCLRAYMMVCSSRPFATASAGILSLLLRLKLPLMLMSVMFPSTDSPSLRDREYTVLALLMITDRPPFSAVAAMTTPRLTATVFLRKESSTESQVDL